LAIALSWMLGRVLRSGLKAHLEAISRQPRSPISAEQTPDDPVAVIR
jgi:hypothetical protein